MNFDILLVEDDDDLRDCLAEILESYGYRVLVASSAGSAISLLDAGSEVDLILSDYVMRDGNGIELLKHVRRKDPVHPAFFLVTGQSDVKNNEARILGAQEFVAKPFDIPDLLSAIGHHLEKQPTKMKGTKK